MKIYKWGILGAGSIAEKFASDLKLLPNADLYAIGSKSSKRANDFAAKFDIKNAYGSYEELASDPNIDIIYIASRHTGHYPDSILCLNHGKAVLCEKPVAMNAKQFEQMVALAHRKNIFFMEALWTRFIPSFLKVKELVEQGIIGEVKVIESDFCFQAPYSSTGRLFNPMLGGGSLLDIGLYPIFLALQLGSEIKDIKAMASFDKTGVDHSCSILLDHVKGEMSVLYCSLLVNGKVESMIHGTEGSIRINKWWHTPTSIDIQMNGKEPVHIDFEKPGFGYQYEAAEVMKCINNGKIQSESFSWNHSRSLINLLDKVRNLTGISYPDELERV